MTNPYGYPAPPGGEFARRPNGATAILAGLLGVALAGALGYLPVRVFIDFGVRDLPAHTKIMLGLYLGAALLLLIGALVTFFRAVAGAVLLLLGGLAAAAAVVAEPLLLYPGYFGEFFKTMFQFEPDNAFVRVAAAVGGPVVFALSALPPTFRYLRYQPPLPGYARQSYPPQGR